MEAEAPSREAEATEVEDEDAATVVVTATEDGEIPLATPPEEEGGNPLETICDEGEVKRAAAAAEAAETCGARGIE